jgi:CheY-like chemotaxis protein
MTDSPAVIVVEDDAHTLTGYLEFLVAAGFDVPVIGLTAHWSPGIQARSGEVRMHAVLLKPCVPAHLVAELRRVLDRTRF